VKSKGHSFSESRAPSIQKNQGGSKGSVEKVHVSKRGKRVEGNDGWL